jgi:alkylated DNA nucleotide flippase Atl1
MAKKKTWREKLANDKGLPKIVRCEDKGKFTPRWGLKVGDTLVIPAPREVDEIMKKVKRGKVTTISEIRKALAKKHKTTSACPVTSGIFAWIAANAAEEEREQQGKKNITPYWRTLKTEGELNPKYPGGVEEQKKRLEAEGHRIIRKGKRYLVEDYEKSLMEF